MGDLAAAVGGHANTTRHHLRALVVAGLVESTTERGPRPGRPSARYTVTSDGRRALGTGSGDASVEEYLVLAGAFADRLAAQGSDPGEDARAVGRSWGAALAARDREAGTDQTGSPRGRVLALLDRLGFSPDAAAPEVRLRTCPLLEAARRHPEVVCQVHAGLVGGADAAYGGTGSGVRLRPFAAPGACLLTLPPGR